MYSHNVHIGVLCAHWCISIAIQPLPYFSVVWCKPGRIIYLDLLCGVYICSYGIVIYLSLLCSLYISKYEVSWLSGTIINVQFTPKIHSHVEV